MTTYPQAAEALKLGTLIGDLSSKVKASESYVQAMLSSGDPPTDKQSF